MADDRAGENRREFCRVEVCIPFACRLVPPEEQNKIRSHICGSATYTRHEALPEVRDAAIAEWLNLLNGKLDTIIRHLTLERDGFNDLPFESINIGGGGLRFSSRERYQRGDMLELRMVLSPLHPIALCVYATVSGVCEQGPDGNYSTAVQFARMDETIQEEIVRFVFEQEREILRGRKGQWE
ncbi:MAG: PilZ domain-containing protein [Syntrophales bacterium]